VFISLLFNQQDETQEVSNANSTQVGKGRVEVELSIYFQRRGPVVVGSIEQHRTLLPTLREETCSVWSQSYSNLS